MPAEGIDGNVPSCTGKGGSDTPKPPREEKNKDKLVRIGSGFFSKYTTTTRKFNFGVELGKAPTGVRFKSLNKLSSEKTRVYNPVNPKAPEDSPLPAITEDEVESQ